MYEDVLIILKNCLVKKLIFLYFYNLYNSIWCIVVNDYLYELMGNKFFINLYIVYKNFCDIIYNKI